MNGEQGGDLAGLVKLLTRERDMLADEVQVKTQMCVSLANTHIRMKEALLSAKAASTDKDHQLRSNVDEVTSLKQALQEATGRVAAAERRNRDMESELEALRHAARHADKKMEASAATEAALAKAQQELVEMHRTMEDWKLKVKEALKENRRKEAAASQNDLEQKRQLAKLQEALDKATFELETLRLKGAVTKPPPAVVETAVQTDRHDTPPRVASPLSIVPSIALPPPQSLALSPNAFSEVPQHSRTPDQTRPDAAPFASPPPIKPILEEKNAQPMIVTVHYGSSDGWTVDTKTLVKPGDTVYNVIADVCERVNSRYARNLDCAEMCLKTYHPKAKRFIVLSEHREMHSFAYFRRCSQESKPINLNLEVLTEAAIFASPLGRLPSTRAPVSRSRGGP